MTILPDRTPRLFRLVFLRCVFLRSSIASVSALTELSDCAIVAVTVSRQEKRSGHLLFREFEIARFRCSAPLSDSLSFLPITLKALT